MEDHEPEAELISIPTVDGYIAQIWTGTSREANVYEGVYKERTFETAYLEYGVMQELVKGTGRRMWFLNDPIEDLPSYTWENYNTTTEEPQWHPCCIRISGTMKSARGPTVYLTDATQIPSQNCRKDRDELRDRPVQADPPELFHAAVWHVPAFR